MWNYMVGLEKFVKDIGDNLPSRELIEKDKDSRISRIVGDFYKFEQYVRNLWCGYLENYLFCYYYGYDEGMKNKIEISR